MSIFLTIAGILLLIGIIVAGAYFMSVLAVETKKPDKETMVIIGIITFLVVLVIVCSVIFESGK